MQDSFVGHKEIPHLDFFIFALLSFLVRHLTLIRSQDSLVGMGWMTDESWFGSWQEKLFYVRGGPKNNRNLNVARELEVVARCAARCRESAQYSSSLPRGVSLG